MMEAVLPYLAWAVLLLLGAAVLAVVGFGVRSALLGKARIASVVAFSVPGVLFGVLALFTGSLVQAGILALLVLLGLAAGALFLTGARGLFS